MTGRSFQIGRLAGIPIGISPLWFVVVALITWSLGAAYYPEQVDGIAPGLAYALGLLSALLLFASIILHELGHAVVARRRGVQIEGIDLWLLGGVSKLRGSPHAPGDELRYAAAGPAVTVAVAAFFGLVALALPDSTPAALRAVIDYQVLINSLILGFNLLPAFPLDGGRVLRALIWSRVGDITRATALAANVGRLFAYGFIGLGVLAALTDAVGGLWFALIGFFLLMAGQAEERGQQVRKALGGHEARELMAFPAVTIPAELTAEDAVSAYFARYRFRAFPVLADGRVVGLVTVDRVEALSPEQRRSTRIAEITDDDPGLFINEHTDVASLLDVPAFQRVGRAVVLTEAAGVGILSLTEVERALRALRLVGKSGARSPLSEGR